MPKNANRVLSVSQVAKLLGKPASTVRRWCKDGLLPSMKAGKKGKYMIREKDLESLNYKPENEEEQ